MYVVKNYLKDIVSILVIFKLAGIFGYFFWSDLKIKLNCSVVYSILPKFKTILGKLVSIEFVPSSNIFFYRQAKEKER